MIPAAHWASNNSLGFKDSFQTICSNLRIRHALDMEECVEKGRAFVGAKVRPTYLKFDTKRPVRVVLFPPVRKRYWTGLASRICRRSAAIEPFDAAFLWLIAGVGNRFRPFASLLYGRACRLLREAVSYIAVRQPASLPTRDWRRGGRVQTLCRRQQCLNCLFSLFLRNFLSAFQT